MKYRYRAISDRKEEKRGILEAENQMQAVAMIRENGDLILELEQVHKWWEVLTGDIYVAGIVFQSVCRCLKSRDFRRENAFDSWWTS